MKLGVSWITLVIIVIVAVVVGVVAANYVAVYQNIQKIGHISIQGFFQAPFQGKKIAHILMIGVDNSGLKDISKGGLSDTLVVFSLNTETREIRGISIPRDTYVEIPGYRGCKINAAHAHGGPELSRQVVGTLLNTPIDYYVKTDVDGLVKMVDMLGGVYIVVDKDMHYTDHKAGLYINLTGKPGIKQLLNGKDAMGYVRFRHDAFGDTGYTYDKQGNKVPTGRITRQQQFFKALANRILSLPNSRARSDFLRKCYENKYIVSDLNAVDWNGIADYFKDSDPEKMHMDVVPGTPKRMGKGSYYVADDTEIPKVVAMDMDFIGDPADQNIAVEVLNGSGRPGMAKSASEKLTGAGFQVAKTGNAPNFAYPKAVIITRVTKTGAVERIAKLFNSQDIREEQLTPGQPEVTVIVGQDYVR